MKLLVWVTSWQRPQRLKDTLDSIKRHADVPYDIVVIDNESLPETRNVIASHKHFLFQDNKGINWPLQHILPGILNHQYIMVCDHDLHFTRPFSLYIEILTRFRQVAIAKGLDGPEHPETGELYHRNERWILKDTERGAGMVMSASWLLDQFPLPEDRINFDTHLCSNLQWRKIAILPGACIHTGWQDSTWQEMTPERYVLQNGRVIRTRI